MHSPIYIFIYEIISIANIFCTILIVFERRAQTTETITPYIDKLHPNDTRDVWKMSLLISASP